MDPESSDDEANSGGASPRKRERLHKFIANCGYCSRRKAELLIQHGLVQIDGRVVDDVGARVVPGHHVVTINGERLDLPRALTIALNKPAGFITSTHDTHERLTVMDLLPRELRQAGVLPAGRLDLDTEGLLILTNDGDLQHRITHPRYVCEKHYHATLDRRPREAELEKLRGGVFLEEVGKQTQPATISLNAAEERGPCIADVIIHEGMKRQVRRTFETVGVRVTHLTRLRIGNVALGALAPGEWRALTVEEIDALAHPTSDIPHTSGDSVPAHPDTTGSAPERANSGRPSDTASGASRRGGPRRGKRRSPAASRSADKRRRRS